MSFLISPPLSPILRVAEHLVVDCEPTLAYTQPSAPILKSADGQSYIVVTHQFEVTHEAGDAHEVKGSYEVKVTHKAEQKYDRTIDQLFHTPPSNNLWRLCYVAADKFEGEDSNWGKITSTPGICVLGKRLDGFYEVAVDESYIPWLRRHNFLFLDKAEFEFLLCYDPTQPMEIEVEVYGKRAFYLRFIENAFGAIWSGCGPGLELCLRSIAPSDLQTALEWTILNRDILASKPQVQKKFSLCLLFLALCLLRDYDTPLAIQLLEKDQNEVLQAFKKDLEDLLIPALAQRHNRKAETLFIGFLRCLLILAGGPKDLYQVTNLLRNVQEYTAIDILKLCGSLVGVTGSNHLGNSDLQAMLNALSRSNVLTDEDISTLDVAELISQLMTFLPIGFQSDEVVQLPLKLCASPNIYPPHVPEEQSMKVSNVLPGSVHELEKGYGNRKMGSGDVMKLRLGGTGRNLQKSTEDVNLCLSSLLKELKLMTLFVDYDGLYEDYQGTQQRLSNKVLRVVQTMKVGQKVLIIEKEDRNPEEEKEDRGKETRIWVVEALQVLQIRAGHLSFGPNVPVHQTIRGEKPKMIKRSVRQRIRRKLEEPRVQSSAFGLGRIFSFVCWKFLSKSSNRGYVEL